MKVESWEDMDKKYQVSDREELTEKQHKEFVADCFNLYEKEGFAKVFWSPHESLGDKKAIDYEGKPFRVIRRLETKKDKVDLISLPMWKIKFDDGYETDAYPEEIVVREMRDNGCDLEI